MREITLWKAAIRALSVANFEEASQLMLSCWEEFAENELIYVPIDKESVRDLADIIDSACTPRNDQKQKLTSEQEENLRSWFKMFLDEQNPNPCE